MLVAAGDWINEHFEFVAAHLVERFKLRPDEILELDRDWIYDVYFHPRDKDGRLIEPPQGERYSPFSFEAFAEKWRRQGIVDPEVLREWWKAGERERMNNG